VWRRYILIFNKENTFVEIYGIVMYDFRWYYLLVLISNCGFNFNVLIQGTDVKGFDDSVLFKINWPGRSGSDLFVSNC
jgi:hypothetical protein